MPALKQEKPTANLDEKALAARISGAFAAEKNYSLINETKINSMSSLATYDQFKDAVLAAHLKPVNLHETPLYALAAPEGRHAKKATVSEDGYKTEYRSTIDYGENLDQRELFQQETTDTLESNYLTRFVPGGNPPVSAITFDREWQKYCRDPHHRYRYLMALNPVEIPNLVRGCLDGDLCSAVLDCVSTRINFKAGQDERATEAVPPDTFTWRAEVEQIWSVLSGLAATQRFALSASFLGQKDKANVQTIFDALDKFAAAHIVEEAPPQPEAEHKVSETSPITTESKNKPAAPATEKSTSPPKAIAFPMMLPGWEGVDLSNHCGSSDDLEASTKSVKTMSINEYIAAASRKVAKSRKVGKKTTTKTKAKVKKPKFTLPLLTTANVEKLRLSFLQAV